MIAISMPSLITEAALLTTPAPLPASLPLEKPPTFFLIKGRALAAINNASVVRAFQAGLTASLPFCSPISCIISASRTSINAANTAVPFTLIMDATSCTVVSITETAESILTSLKWA